MELKDKIEIKAKQRWHDSPFICVVYYRKADTPWYEYNPWRKILIHEYAHYLPDSEKTLDFVRENPYCVESLREFADLRQRLLTYHDVVKLQVEKYNELMETLKN